eukprot:9014596-Pyramimonas_sp.AAC.1
MASCNEDWLDLQRGRAIETTTFARAIQSATRARIVSDKLLLGVGNAANSSKRLELIPRW